MNYLNLEKRIIATLSAGLAVSSLGLVKADAFGVGDVDFKVVNTETLNVRTAPNTNAPVKRTLKNGDVVRPIELNESKTWGRIGANEWVSLAYLEMIDNSTIPENGVEYEKVDFTPYIVNTDLLELRDEPSALSKVVGSFKKGTKVFATEKNGAWLKIEDGHFAGWVVDHTLKPYTNDDTITLPSDNKPSINFEEETISAITIKLKANIYSAQVRETPSMKSSAIGWLTSGQEFKVTIKSGGWYKVTASNGKVGWLHKDCIEEVKTVTNNTVTKPSTSFKEESIETKEIEVKVNSAKIRTAPSMDASVAGYVKEGDLSFTSTKSGNWYKVNFSGKKGWIHRDCVKDVIGSMNSTLDDLVDVAPGDTQEEDMSMNATYDDLVDVAPGDVDMTRTVVVPENDVLNVRESFLLIGIIKDTLDNGTKVTVITDYGTASRIKYINSKGVLEFGYVASRYLK